MKTNANSLRVGNIIGYQNELWRILKRDHVKPGKGGAYVQIEMKNISTGTKTNIRLSSSDDVDVAFVEKGKYQFQYFDQDNIVTMDMQSFETYSFDKNLISQTALNFLQEGMEITVEYCNEKPISASLEENVKAKVELADAVVKGQTAASSNKPATLENGLRVMVPTFVNSGDEIIVKSETGEYVERVKK